MSDAELKELLKQARTSAMKIQETKPKGITLGEFYVALKMLVKGIEDSKQVPVEMAGDIDNLLTEVLVTKLKKGVR